MCWTRSSPPFREQLRALWSLLNRRRFPAKLKLSPILGLLEAKSFLLTISQSPLPVVGFLLGIIPCPINSLALGRIFRLRVARGTDARAGISGPAAQRVECRRPPFPSTLASGFALLCFFPSPYPPHVLLPSARQLNWPLIFYGLPPKASSILPFLNPQSIPHSIANLPHQMCNIHTKSLLSFTSISHPFPLFKLLFSACKVHSSLDCC
jgi:hypothetical protein